MPRFENLLVTREEDEHVVDGIADSFGGGVLKKMALRFARRVRDPIDADLLALSKRIDSLALDQSRFIDAMTEQVQALTAVVNRLQLQLEEAERAR